jgi:hypothetical protein
MTTNAWLHVAQGELAHLYHQSRLFVEHWNSAVSILRQSRRLYGCWPLKGASSQPLKAKQEQKQRLLFVHVAEYLPKGAGKAYPRKCQTSTATSAEPGELSLN